VLKTEVNMNAGLKPDFWVSFNFQFKTLVWTKV